MKRMRGLRLGGNCNCNGKEVGFVCAKGPAKEKKKKAAQKRPLSECTICTKAALEAQVGCGYQPRNHCKTRTFRHDAKKTGRRARLRLAPSLLTARVNLDSTTQRHRE